MNLPSQRTGVAGNRGLRGVMCALLLALPCASSHAADPAASSPPLLETTVADTGSATGPDARVFFVLAEVNGKEIRTSVADSHAVNYGKGPSLQVVLRARPVPSGRVSLRLVASTQYGMPIQQLFASRTAYYAEGSIDVELKPGVRYRVTGALDTYRREVWLEEVEGGAIIGRKIVQPPTAEQLAELATADRYTCCNLRYGDRWVSDANWVSLPFIPAGARVKITGWGRFRAHVNVEGRPLSAGVDWSRDVETREQFADKVFVKENPALRIAAFPAAVQAAVRAGKVMPGMTREQVIVALGYPRRDLTSRLDANRWVYTPFESTTEEFDLTWNADGRLAEINASSRVKALVVYAP